jgi:hypothetical protein
VGVAFVLPQEKSPAAQCGRAKVFPKAKQPTTATPYARTSLLRKFRGPFSMSIPDDIDPDTLISRLAGPLAPADRDAFRRAAEEALARMPCWGEGAAYRAVAVLQRAYFTPPADHRVGWDISQDLRSNKLTDGPPIEYGGDLRHVRYRQRVR